MDTIWQNRLLSLLPSCRILFNYVVYFEFYLLYHYYLNGSDDKCVIPFAKCHTVSLLSFHLLGHGHLVNTAYMLNQPSLFNDQSHGKLFIFEWQDNVKLKDSLPMISDFWQFLNAYVHCIYYPWKPFKWDDAYYKLSLRIGDMEKDFLGTGTYQQTISSLAIHTQEALE